MSASSLRRWRSSDANLSCARRLRSASSCSRCFARPCSSWKYSSLHGGPGARGGEGAESRDGCQMLLHIMQMCMCRFNRSTACAGVDCRSSTGAHAGVHMQIEQLNSLRRTRGMQR